MLTTKVHWVGLRIQELSQRADDIGREGTLGEARLDEVEESIVFVQHVPMVFENGDQDVAETAIGAEGGGVDGSNSFEEMGRVQGFVQLCQQHTLGERFQERNVVLVGHGVHARVEVEPVVAVDGVIVAAGVASREELAQQTRRVFVQFNDA